MPSAFQVEELDGGIALVTFDVPDKKVNTLSEGVLRELAGLVGQLAQRTDLRGLLLRERQARAVHRRGRSQRPGRAGVHHAGAGGQGPRRRPSDLQRTQPAAIPDRRPDRRQLPGRRDRAVLVDGRPAGLRGAPHAGRLAGGQDRPDSRLGRDPATASPHRAESGDRDDHIGRAGLRPEGRRSGPGLRCGPGRSARRGRRRDGSSTSRRAENGRSVANGCVSRWGSIRMR